MKFTNWFKNTKNKLMRFFNNIIGNNNVDVTLQSKGQDVQLLAKEITEENKAFEIALAVQGFNKNDINITIEDGFLTISAEKEMTKEEKNDQWIYKEFNSESVIKTFKLPANADSNKVNATVDAGILKVIIEKNKSSQYNIRNIAIA